MARVTTLLLLLWLIAGSEKAHVSGTSTTNSWSTSSTPATTSPTNQTIYVKGILSKPYSRMDKPAIVEALVQPIEAKLISMGASYLAITADTDNSYGYWRETSFTVSFNLDDAGSENLLAVAAALGTGLLQNPKSPTLMVGTIPYSVRSIRTSNDIYQYYNFDLPFCQVTPHLCRANEICSNNWPNNYEENLCYQKYFLRYDIAKAYNSSDDEEIKGAVMMHLQQFVAFPAVGDVFVEANLFGETMAVVNVSDTSMMGSSILTNLEDYIVHNFYQNNETLHIQNAFYDVSSVKLFDDEDKASDDSYALVLSQYCLRYRPCGYSDQFVCVPETFGYTCAESCSYGYYSSNRQCVQCATGTTTLLKGATSADQCVSDCQDGEDFRLQSQMCQACPSQQYKGPGQSRCSVCPYQGGTDTTCAPGPLREVVNGRVDISVKLELTSLSCEIQDTTQYSRDKALTSLIRYLFLGSVYSTASYGAPYYNPSQPPHKGLCLPDFICSNIRATAAVGQLCEMDTSCTDPAHCGRFRSTLDVTVYNAWELTTNLTNGQNYTTVEQVLHILSNGSNLNQIISMHNYVISSLTPATVTPIDYSERVLFGSVVINETYDDPMGVHGHEFSEMKSEMGIVAEDRFQLIEGFLYPEFNSIGNFFYGFEKLVQFNFTMVFGVSVDGVVDQVAELMVKSHQLTAGDFGRYNFIGPMSLYTTEENMKNGIQAVSWCDVFHGLGLDPCQNGGTCTEENVFYACGDAPNSTVTYFIAFKLNTTYTSNDENLLENVRVQVDTGLNFGGFLYTVQGIGVMDYYGYETSVVLSVTTDVQFLGQLEEFLVLSTKVQEMVAVDSSGNMSGVTSANLFLSQVDAEGYYNALDMHVCPKLSEELCGAHMECSTMGGTDFYCNPKNVIYYLRLEFAIPYSENSTTQSYDVQSQMKQALVYEHFISLYSSNSFPLGAGGESTAMIFYLQVYDARETDKVFQSIAELVAAGNLEVSTGNGIVHSPARMEVYESEYDAQTDMSPLDLDVCKWSTVLCGDATCESGHGFAFTCGNSTNTTVSNFTTTDSWNNFTTTNSYNNFTTTDSWNSSSSTPNPSNFTTTDSWNNFTTTDSWNNFTTTNSYNSSSSTPNPSNFTTTDSWNSDSATDNWSSDSTIDIWSSSSPTNNWRGDSTTDIWSSSSTTNNWRGDSTADIWSSSSPTNNWRGDSTADIWSSDSTTDIWSSSGSSFSPISSSPPDNWRSDSATDIRSSSSAPFSPISSSPTDKWRSDSATDIWSSSSVIDNWSSSISSGSPVSSSSTDVWSSSSTADNWSSSINPSSSSSTDSPSSISTTDSWSSSSPTDNWSSSSSTTSPGNAVSTGSPSTAQRDLYPYGLAVGDRQVTAKGLFEWDYWEAISDAVKIQGGFPFGREKFTYVHVLPHGVITVGQEKWAWWPDLEWAPTWGLYVIAPFWSYMDPRRGKVFYQLHERRTATFSGGTGSIAVLTRASMEVQEFLQSSGTFANSKPFKATSVLVATWEEVEPYNWMSWYCDDQYSYMSSWYDCSDQGKETNTFQTLLITDGQRSFVLTTYKLGSMTWSFEEYRYIEVGYASPTPEFRKNNHYYNTEITTMLDSETGNTGRMGTDLDLVGIMENPDAKCEEWYLENSYLVNNDTFDQMVEGLFDCPCTMERLGRQWWTYKWEDVIGETRTYLVCAALSPVAKQRLERLEGNTLNRMCCYKIHYPDLADHIEDDGVSVNYTSYFNAWWDAYQSASFVKYNDPDAGHVLLHDPWSWFDDSREFRQQDMLPHKWCCRDAKKRVKSCALFNKVRPQEQCNPNATFVSGLALGDPHIKMSDGIEYTMNGLGEYILLKVSSEDFYLQGRTAQALNKDKKETRATVFVAFAVKEMDATFQVELNDTMDGMIIRANGDELTTDFYSDEKYMITSHETVGVERKKRDSDGRISVTATFPSTISVTVYVGIRNLEFSIDLPAELRGKASGLLGNFDGKSDNDFILPDGSELPASSVDTEREILENFAEPWRVTTSNSVFSYDDNKTTLNYQNYTFTPIFLDDVNASVLLDAQNQCSGDYACVFDLIATEDESFAKYSLASNKEANTVQSSQANSPPSITLLTATNAEGHVEVTEGTPVTLTFQATDPDGDNVTYTLVSGSQSGVQFDASSGSVTLTPDTDTPVAIGVQAKDSKGASSVAEYVVLAVCPLCNGQGSCDRSDTREEELAGGRFLLNDCICKPAYKGDDCEELVDGCASKPCTTGQDCTNLAPNEDEDNERRYRCGACPEGYVGDAGNVVCADINECANTTHPVCPALSRCVNSVGSFSCVCLQGFRQDAGNIFKCNDINECAEGTHQCQQQCDNTEGTYSCSCLPGNTLQGDGRTCVQDSSIQDICNTKGCSGTCSVDDNQNAVCGCQKGFQLSGATACVDIDECSTENKYCSQACHNTQGGFSCSCYKGYQLQEDQTSCKKCKYPYFGDNCAGVCACNGRGSCDHVRGCVCDSGWTGPTCALDVNECQTLEQPCPDNQECVNSLGSYTCNCRPGYHMESGNCVDVNECEDVLDHSCRLGTENCLNTVGSYDCPCRPGYARNQQGDCENVDECARGIHKCQHICVDTQGSYNCRCYLGFRLDSDRRSCVQSEDVCEGVTNLNCEQICSVDQEKNEAFCQCDAGYELQGTEACVDVNECDPKFPHLNLCDYKPGCVNTERGFLCSCGPGTRLDNDGRTCVECSGGRWGENCTQDCDCSENAVRCDPERGCVCKSGFSGVHCEKDIDECMTGLVTCSDKEQCVDTPGSARCDCVQGLHRVNGQCVDKNECAFTQDNDCTQVCENLEGGYQCACYQGYSYNAVNKTCTDVDECALGTAGCEGDCENTEGGYRCTCAEGLRLNTDGVTCRVADTCDPSTNVCGEKEKCRMVDGQALCSCSRGKILDPTDNSTCLDIDLCASGEHPCSHTCEETTDGASIICSCPTGMTLASDGFLCVDCTEGKYGSDCKLTCSCDPLHTISCDKVHGTCSCAPGWTGDTCDQDVDECGTAGTCLEHADCVNTPGAYLCKCQLGFFTNTDFGSNCTACSAGSYGEECKHQCECSTEHTQSCDPVSGACTCDAGWTGSKCDTDVVECGTNLDTCASSGRLHWGCINDPGSFHCDCVSGYTEDNGDCVDINECEKTSTHQCQHDCSNTVGGYSCSCHSGYQLNTQDGHQCDDIDECTQNPSVCAQECTNIPGSYSCSCQPGYKVHKNDSSQCYEALSTNFEISLDIDASGKNLNEKQGPDYLELSRAILPALLEAFSNRSEATAEVTINNLRHGSVIVDATVFADKALDTLSASQVVEALVAMARDGLMVNGTMVSATVTLGGTTVTTNSDKCEILALVEPCSAGSSCAINADGLAYCPGEEEDSVDIALIVGLCLGIALIIAVAVAVGLVVKMKLKNREQRRVESREGHYFDDDLRPPSANSYGDIPPSTAHRKPSGASRIAWANSDTKQLVP